MAKTIPKFKPRRSKKAGLSPGTIVHFGERKQEESTISFFSYNENVCIEKTKTTFEEILNFKKDLSTVEWININAIHDTRLIEKIGAAYNLHSLLLEDIVSTHQRPKIDEYDNCLYVVIRMLYFDEINNEIKTEQISFVLQEGTVISFQEKEGDVFDYVRNRLRQSKGRIRKSGSDYLLYALLDSIVDNYFIILEKVGDKIEAVETELFENPNETTSHQIHQIKQEMIYLKKSIWPLREVINSLNKSEHSLIKPGIKVFMKDLYDHIIQIIDTTETYRDILSGMLDMYLSSVSNKMNQVMKVLTIIATIFIPLTFIAGVYGMNFDYMPELRWKYGYLMVWIIMLAVFIGMIYYFKKKKWI